jgi:hypothetical protein
MALSKPNVVNTRSFGYVHYCDHTVVELTCRKDGPKTFYSGPFRAHLAMLKDNTRPS